MRRNGHHQFRTWLITILTSRIMNIWVTSFPPLPLAPERVSCSSNLWKMFPLLQLHLILLRRLASQAACLFLCLPFGLSAPLSRALLLCPSCLGLINLAASFKA